MSLSEPRWSVSSLARGCGDARLDLLDDAEGGLVGGAGGGGDIGHGLNLPARTLLTG